MSSDEEKDQPGGQSRGLSKPKQQVAETTEPLREQEATGVADRGNTSAQIDE